MRSFELGLSLQKQEVIYKDLFLYLLYAPGNYNNTNIDHYPTTNTKEEVKKSNLPQFP